MGYQKWAIQCFAPCSFSAPPLSYGACEATPKRPMAERPFWRDGRTRSSPSRSPTKRRESYGRFYQRRNISEHGAVNGGERLNRKTKTDWPAR